MISVQNRLPEPGKENRVSITPDSGSALEGVLAYADDATQEGTFWNRKTAQLLQGDIRTYPVRSGQSISAGDVVNVGAESDGQPDTIYKDVVPQDNVENIMHANAGNATGTSSTKLTDSTSIVSFSQGGLIRLMSFDNNAGTTNQGNYGDISINTISGYSVDRLSDSRFVVQYFGTTPYNELYARICTCESGSVTAGSQYTLLSSAPTSQTIIGFSETFALSIYNSSGLKAKVLPISGTTITTTGTVYSLPNNTGANYISACRLPDEGGNKRVCICFSDTGDGNKGKAVIATIDSSNAVTFGDVVTFENIENVISTSCNPVNDHANVSWITNGYHLKMVSISPDGTLGTPITVMENEISGYLTSAVVGDKIVTSGRTTEEEKQVFTMVEDSNSTLQVVSSSLIDIDMRYPSAASISDNRILYAYSNLNNSQYGTTTILEVSGNQIAGSFLDNSSDAIALADGTGGQEIPVGFGGYCECPGVTEGERVDSSGVSAFSPLDGWLSILDARYKGYVVGEYTGTGTYGANNPTIIDVGFSPVAVAVFMPDNTFYCLMFNGWNRTVVIHYAEVYGANIVEFTLNGISFYYSAGPNPAIAQMNQEGQLYKYIAWR